MAGINLGPTHDLAIRIQKFEDQVRDLSTRDVLRNASIGAGGITVNGGNINITSGGSLIVTGSGTIQLSTGTFVANVVNANSSVNAPSANISGTTTTNVLKATSAPTTIISAGRVAGWIQNSDGLLGTQPSSERFKKIIGHVLDDPDFDPFAVLELDVEYFEYLIELRKRDDPTFAEYVGPRYKVALNFGPIAEHAHALGLWMIVIYEHDLVPVLLPDGSEAQVEQLRLNEAGDPIPFGLHESLFGYLLQMSVKRMRADQLVDHADLHALADHAGFTLPSTVQAE